MITLGDLIFRSERNSWFSGYVFSGEEFCIVAVLQESKTLKRNQMFIKAVWSYVLTWWKFLWFAVEQFRISVFYF